MEVVDSVVSYWIYLSQWIARYKRILLAGCGGIFFVVVLGQLLYPAEQALPRAYLGNNSVRGQSYDQLVERIITEFQNAEVEIKAGDRAETLALSEIGAVVQAEAMAKNMLDYPWWQRLIPFSILKSSGYDSFVLELDEQQLETAAAALSQKLSRPAQNATFAIDGGALTATEAVAGENVLESSVSESLKEADFEFGSTELRLDIKTVLPEVTDDDVATIRSQAEEILKREIIIESVGGKEFRPSQEDIAAWLSVKETESAHPELTLDHEKMGGYIGKLNAEVGIIPGTAVAILIDGEEISRTSAPSGLAIAADELKEGIERALFNESAEKRLSARLVIVPPLVRYERSYTSSEKGLRAYIDYISSTENIRVAVAEVGGKGWSAGGRSDEKTVSASTYKLYVAYMVYKQVSEKKMEWSTQMIGTDVATCLERMIVLSDNPCAEEFVRMIGGKQINAQLHAKGISASTTLITDDGIAQTTAGDLEKMLRGLEQGTLMNGGDRQNLLEKMERQRFRLGIPAGSSGKVYNKVGFLWDYINDAAIVRHQKGTYTIAIITKGSNWGKVAEITRQIEKILYP